MRIATRMRIAGTWAATVVGLVIGNTAEVKADHMVYATADNGNGSNLFGTMDLTTGQFTQIATTTPLFGSLAAGPGGTLYGGAGSLNFGLYAISPAGVTSPFGTVTAPPLGLAPGFLGLAPQGFRRLLRRRNERIICHHAGHSHLRPHRVRRQQFERRGRDGHLR